MIFCIQFCYINLLEKNSFIEFVKEIICFLPKLNKLFHISLIGAEIYENPSLLPMPISRVNCFSAYLNVSIYDNILRNNTQTPFFLSGYDRACKLSGFSNYSRKPPSRFSFVQNCAIFVRVVFEHIFFLRLVGMD